jgi:hypothetical protein
VEVGHKVLEQNDSLHHTTHPVGLQPLELNPGMITIDNIVDNHEARVASGLKGSDQLVLLSVADNNTVMRLWKDGLVHGLFRAEDTFSKPAFDKFLDSAATSEELRFCLKVIVWLHTNWQTEVVLDLNISFFGGQFKSFIVGGKPQIGDEVVACVDYITLQTLIAAPEFSSNIRSRKLVVCDLQSFERFMSSGFGTRVGWGTVLYLLKLIYNPETDFGDLHAKDEVISALIATDLFFSLVYMLLHQTYPYAQYATVDDLDYSHGPILVRLQQAAENLHAKLMVVQEKSEGADLTRLMQFLNSFFKPSPGRVKWIAIDERNLFFADQPIDIAPSVQEVTRPFLSVSFTETVTNAKLLSYLVDRLGLDTDISDIGNKYLPNNLRIIASEGEVDDQKLYAQIIESPLPLIVVFPDLLAVKNFYNSHYEKIKENAALFAQGYSGGGNKMFRNFSIRENSVLLVTADFMAKQNYKIPAQTIIFAAPPVVETTHPYTAALLRHWSGKHEDLISVFELAKITAALKKVKLDEGVTVQTYNFEKNRIFVDNPR